jgi:hypothetical protein
MSKHKTASRLTSWVNRYLAHNTPSHLLRPSGQDIAETVEELRLNKLVFAVGAGLLCFTSGRKYAAGHVARFSRQIFSFT